MTKHKRRCFACGNMSNTTQKFGAVNVCAMCRDKWNLQKPTREARQ